MKPQAETPQMYDQTDDLTWTAALPKVELHLHLEGAIPLDTLWLLVQKYGGDPDVQDFPHFIETWYWKNQFLRHYEDFTTIAEAVAGDLYAQNIRYAEVYYSPIEYERYGLSVSELTQSIRKGLDRVLGIEVALIPDLVRDAGPTLGMRMLEQLKDLKGYGVIGIGIGGSEQNHPPEPWENVYTRARELGFHTTAHAGEADGAKSIWGAIRTLKVERIGHGTRAEEDPLLLDYLAEKRLPLEMCPISNVRTNVVSSIESHPIRRYYEKGLMVTVNTDDPKMFGNALADEYALLINKLGFTRHDIQLLIRNGIESSWLTASEKHTLTDTYTQDPAWLSG